MTGTLEYEKGDKRPEPDFNQFFRQYGGYPYYSDAIWYLTQMRRWGQIAEQKPDGWYMDMAKKAYRPDIYVTAAKELIAEAHTSTKAAITELRQLARGIHASVLDDRHVGEADRQRRARAGMMIGERVGGELRGSARERDERVGHYRRRERERGRIEYRRRRRLARRVVYSGRRRASE
jgi:hypothetical protein